MPNLPQRATGIPRSGIREIMDLVWASPDPVIRLEVGQPDATPPEHVMDAMIRAIEDGETAYTPNAGIPELREACGGKLARVNNIDVDLDGVLITAGAMQGISVAIGALCDPGDELLVPNPGWPNYEMACRLASVRPVPYSLEPQLAYRPDIDELAALVTDRTRAVLVNSPSNPLGVVLDRSDHEAILTLAADRDLWVISDECYDEITFGDPAVSPAALPGGSDQVLTIHSFSKTYSMTGLRVGYVSGPAPAIATMTKMQEATIACVNGVAQHGAVAALTGPQDYVEQRRQVYARRRNTAVETATRLGLEHVAPEGAFYFWLPLGGPADHSMEFCHRLVREHHVAVAPGATFGTRGEGAVRVALAAAEEDIVEGIERIARAVAGD